MLNALEKRMDELMSQIRILHIITRLIVGGAQETVMYTAEKLDPIKYQVEMVSGPQTGSEGSLLDEVHCRKIPVRILPELVREINPLKDCVALWKLYRLCRDGKYQIVHTHSSKAGILGRIAARMAGTPVIVHTVHGWSFHAHMSTRTRLMYILLERLTASFTDALVVVTSQDKPKGLGAKIGLPDQYHLIRSAIPIEEFSPKILDPKSIRAELGIPLDAPVIGNVGRFSAQKNPLDWVKVAGVIGRAIPKCHFLLVGDGPLRSQVEAALQEQGISNRTILTGLRRDPARMMAAMDVFLLTSLWEGLPRVIPQAMLMELPIVATRIDGTAEALDHSPFGVAGTSDDLGSLADHCLILLKDPLLRAKIGEQSRNYALEEFGLEKMISQTELLYDQLLSSSTGK